jgi:CheY-like chemotaxis protein/HPt (histidine-containing phosphotransfer) domain-containing protein
MNDTISANSDYGNGSVFSVKIKQKIATNELIGSDIIDSLKEFRYSVKQETTARHDRVSLMDIRVLVVDDNKVNLDVAKGMLKLCGIKNIDCLTGGQEAIDAIREEKFEYSAIFMDHMMPEIDGIEATRLIRKIGTEYAKTIPIFALTANAIAGNEELFLEKGFQAFIPKPIDPARLKAVIKEWLHNGQDADTAATVNIKESGKHDPNIKINGLNMETGIEQFGSKELYYKMLHSYIVNTRPLLETLKNVNRDNLFGYAITVHGIKGSSHAIFAANIAAKAEALEKAAKAKDYGIVSANNPSFIEDAEKLIADIEDILN